MDPRPFDCHNSGRTVSSSRNQPSSEPRSTAATEAWTQVPMFPQQALGPQLRGQPPPESYNMSTILAIVPIPPVPRTLQGFSNASGHGKAIAEFGSIGVGKQIPSHNGVTSARDLPLQTQRPTTIQRPGRRGSLQCERCRRHKRGSRGYCVTRPDDPDGPCVPCVDANVQETCGQRTYPSGKRKVAKSKRLRTVSQFAKDPGDALVREGRVTPVQHHNNDTVNRFPEILETKVDRGRPDHGLDLQPEISSPTVKIDSHHAYPPLPSFGQQNEALHLGTADLSSPEPPYPTPPLEYDSEVANDAVGSIMGLHLNSAQVQYGNDSDAKNLQVWFNKAAIDVPQMLEERGVAVAEDLTEWESAFEREWSAYGDTLYFPQL